MMDALEVLRSSNFMRTIKKWYIPVDFIVCLVSDIASIIFLSITLHTTIA